MRKQSVVINRENEIIMEPVEIQGMIQDTRTMTRLVADKERQHYRQQHYQQIQYHVYCQATTKINDVRQRYELVLYEDTSTADPLSWHHACYGRCELRKVPKELIVEYTHVPRFYGRVSLRDLREIHHDLFTVSYDGGDANYPAGYVNFDYDNWCKV